MPFQYPPGIIQYCQLVSHDGGVQAVGKALSSSQYTNDEREMILTLFQLVLTNNYFLFEGTYYLQLCGTAMGTNVAPNNEFININYTFFINFLQITIT